MKKYIALFVFLLCAAILCSCGNAGDKSKTASKLEKTVTETNSEEKPSADTESTPADSGTGASAAQSKTASNSESAQATSSVGSEANTSTASSSDSNPSGSSEGSSVPEFIADEYELPFIPN